MSKITVILLSCFIMTSAFASCSKKNSDSGSSRSVSASDSADADTSGNTETADINAPEFVGKWECIRYEFEGKEHEDYQGTPLAAFRYEILDNGTARTLLYDDEMFMVDWKKVGDNKFNIVSGENIVPVTLDNGSFILESGGGAIYTYKKVDAFTTLEKPVVTIENAE